MKAYIFPGQGSQFPGMAKDLYEQNDDAHDILERGNAILGFRITDIMFEGTEDDLKETRVTQPAIYLHSYAAAIQAGETFEPNMVAGHSLGEFSALAAAGAIKFEDGLKLVYQRALAMQKACEAQPSAMAAILGLDDSIVEEVCASISETVVPANYNSHGQIVISGTVEGIKKACDILTAKGAKRAIVLNVGGAFHSPLMEPAREFLAKAIASTEFNAPRCKIYQNVTAAPETDPEKIRQNLVEQLTAPVRWKQSVERMVTDGAIQFIECGPGRVLQALVKKIHREALINSI